MKKTLLTSVALATVLAFSPVFASEEPMSLSAAQMDNVTAGQDLIAILNQQTNFADVRQTQACVVCLGVGILGNGIEQNQTATVNQTNRIN